MNYYDARKRSFEERWDFTRHENSSGTFPIGYCAGWREDSEKAMKASGGLDPAIIAGVLRLQAKKRPFQSKFHTDGHPTVEEARKCFGEYLLDCEMDFEGTRFEGSFACEMVDCPKQTSIEVTAGQYHRWRLCDDHRTRDVVEKLLVVESFFGSY